MKLSPGRRFPTVAAAPGEIVPDQDHRDAARGSDVHDALEEVRVIAQHRDADEDRPVYHAVGDGLRPDGDDAKDRAHNSACAAAARCRRRGPGGPRT